MKKIGTMSMILIVAMCLATAVCLGNVSEVEAVNGESNTTISVSGTGIIEAEPNQVIVYLGVETQSLNVTEAMEQNSVTMKLVIDAITKRGVPRDSIETSYFNIYPVKDYEKLGEGILGYQVTNEITIELTDLESIGDVINTAISAGANRVTHIEFGLTDEEEQELKLEAIEKACADARLKADAIAKGLGLKIVSVSKAREGNVDIYPYRAVSFAEYAMSVPSPVSAIQPPIEPKDVIISATIQVDYDCL